MVANRGHFPVFHCLQPLRIPVSFKLHLPFCRRRPPSLSLSLSRQRFYLCANGPVCLPSPVFPFLYYPSLLRPFRFLASTLTFISFCASSTLSRQLLAVATLAVDINKHLDYTVKAASTTSPDWKLEDSPIGAAAAAAAAAERHPALPPLRFS